MRRSNAAKEVIGATLLLGCGNVVGTGGLVAVGRNAVTRSGAGTVRVASILGTVAVRAGACNSDDLGDGWVVLSVPLTVAAVWVGAGVFTICENGVTVTSSVACGVFVCAKTGAAKIAEVLSEGDVLAQAQSGNNEAAM